MYGLEPMTGYMDGLKRIECPECNYKKALLNQDNTVYCKACSFNGMRKEKKLVTVKDYII